MNNSAMRGPRWLKFFARVAGIKARVHAEFQTDRTIGSKVMGLGPFFRMKIANKSASKLNIAALDRRIATKFCVHGGKCPTDVLAKFGADRISGLGVTAERLSKSSFLLRKSNGQYSHPVQYLENFMQYRNEILWACSVACSPALV